MKNKYFGPILLVIATLIWGSSFIIMKNAVGFLSTNVLLFVRFTLASLFMIIIFFKYLKQLKRQDFIKGAIVGGCLYAGFVVQTKGLELTSPGKSAFLTAMYCAIIPFLVWLFYRKKPDGYNFVAAFMCFIGVGFVSLTNDLSINQGDILTLIGSCFFALHIITIKRYTNDVHPINLTTLQFCFAAFYALIASLLFEDINTIKHISNDIMFQLLYLALFATAIAILFQNIGQKMISECNASIILSLESVFGVIFSVLFYGEQLTPKVIIGFVLIFIAIIISETKLTFLKRNRSKKE